MVSGVTINNCFRRASHLAAGPSRISSLRIGSIRQISSSIRIQQEAPSTQSSSLTTSSESTQGVRKNDLPSPFEPTKYHPKTHNHHVASLQLQSFGHGKDVERLDSFAKFALRAGYALGIPLSSVESLPTTKSLWTVPRGPFVHKKSQENFERRTNKRLIKVFDSNLDVVNKWLQFLRIHSMAGVGMRAEIFRHAPIGFGKQMLAASTAQLRSTNTENNNTTLHSGQADREKVQLLAKNIVKEELAQQSEEDVQNVNEQPAIEGESKKD